jgi:GT2 family glycosyltransferase
MTKSVFAASKWSLKKNKLAVLVPCRDMLHSGFSKCLVELVKLNTMNGLDTHVVYDASTVLLTQRARLAAEAQAIGAEYMLWLDSDMIFPATTALRLLAHNEPFVAANYIRRQPPYKGVAYETIGDWQNPLPYEPREDLVPVEGMGMGCMLVKTEALEKIPKPWFEFHWTEESNDHLGEDMDFCMKMAEAGYQLKVDTQLSMETRHLGTWAFGPDLLD